VSRPAASIRNPKLYAVVSPARAEKPLLRKIHSTAAVQAERSAEFVLKAQIDRWATVLDRLEARTAAYKKQMAVLKKRQALSEARFERIEESVIRRMGAANVVIAPGFKREFKTNLCPQSVEVLKESDIPKAFMRDKTVTAPDKILISRTLTLGFVVADVNLLPPEFRTETGVADEAAIKAALAKAQDVAGVQPVYEIPGVRLAQRTTLLRA
jgi:hypothetical protein